MSHSVQVRVQHHPSRSELLDRLLPGLAGLPVEVIEHASTPPSPWAGYQLCLSEFPSECEHMLVVQDDAIPCLNLPPAVEQIAKRFPANVVCLFLGRMPALTKRAALAAMGTRASYAEVHHRDWVPCVATLWPRAEAEHLLDWYQRQPPRRHPDRADDGVVGRWKRSERRQVFATVPSLFEHPDDALSTIKKRNGYRTALAWTPDAALHDWA